jgi:GAF domain-containing protein
VGELRRPLAPPLHAVRSPDDHATSMRPASVHDMATRLEQLESLLRRLNRCQSAAAAAAEVGESLPALAGVDGATLLLCRAEGLAPADAAAAVWSQLAAASIAAGAPRSVAADGSGGVAIAVPIEGEAGPAGVLVVLRNAERPLADGEAGVLRIFADHAGAALRRLRVGGAC